MVAGRVLTEPANIPVGDYVSEGLAVVIPDACFPNMVVGDKDGHPWPYLRKNIKHNWYCDRRAPLVGFLSRDEAVLLHNLALQFRGKPGLEIGSWMGWSTCHLALAGLMLDVVDPVFAKPEHLGDVRDSLAAAGVLANVRLYGSASPEGVRELAKLTGLKWNFIFIDGDHEGTAPARDALECVEHAAPDAMIVFHDLVSPNVEAGLRVLWREGWQVALYQTMQIVGVAWRGNATLVSHQPDPSIDWSLPLHLAKYPVIGASPAAERRRLSHGIALRDAEIHALEQTVKNLSEGIAGRDAEMGRLKQEAESAQVTMNRLLDEHAANDLEIMRLRQQTEADERAIQSMQSGIVSRDAQICSFREELNTRHATVERLEGQIATKATHLHEAAVEVERLQNALAVRDTQVSRIQTTVNQRDAEIAGLHRGAANYCSEIERLMGAADALRSKLDWMRYSTSWRVTWPLRAMKSVVASLRHFPQRMADTIAEGMRATSDTRVVNAVKVVKFVVPRAPHVVLDLLKAGITFDRQAAHKAIHAGVSEILFDTDFYLASNPDVREARVNPFRHYLTFGAAEGRDPHPLFSTQFYLGRNPAIRDAHEIPLLHYVMHGAFEGSNPHPLFDSSYYLSKNEDVSKAGVNPLLHYMRHGALEGRNPHPLFDASFYLEQNPDVRAAGVNPLLHYITYGGVEGRDPHPLFDSSYYLQMNPDVVAMGMNPLVHYVMFGASKHRDPHPMFDTSFYVEQHPGLDPEVNPLIHFLAEGPTDAFDPFSSPPELPEIGICIVTPDIVGPVKNGGIGTACYHYARILAAAGHPVSVFFTGDLTDCQKAHWKNAYARMSIRFIALSDAPQVMHFVYGSTWFLERSWRVYEYLRNTAFSVIHFQDWQGNGFWSIKAKRVGLAFQHTRLTVITQACTKWINEGMQQYSDSPMETAKLSWTERYSMEHCDILLSPSAYMLKWLSENVVSSLPRTELTPYTWADPSDFPRTPVDNDHLIFFGRLETRKGLHIFGEALRKMRKSNAKLPRIVSFIGKHASVFGQLSNDYLSDLCADLPSVEIRIINDFDYLQALAYIRETRGLVVIASIVDNYPLTVIECIQNRLSFVAAATGGIPEMVDDRVSFQPIPEALASILAARRSIDHYHLVHKYSASGAEATWRSLHSELVKSGEAEWNGVPEPVRHISVCIPFFNHQRYLDTLISALSHQSYPSFDVTLVNDGSSEEASRAFERAASRCRDRRFRFLTTENSGPGAARNFAARNSAGDLLVFFDADNLPKGNDFLGILESAIRKSGADCVSCPYDIVSDDRIRVTEQDVMTTYRPIGGCIEAGFFENTLGDATLIITREAFNKLGGFPVRRASWEDHEFLLRLSFAGLKLESLPDAMFYYRTSTSGRHLQANEFRNYESLFEHLSSATPGDLARIIRAVSAPMLIGQTQDSAAKLLTKQHGPSTDGTRIDRNESRRTAE